jgi:hypothetical protein
MKNKKSIDIRLKRNPSNNDIKSQNFEQETQMNLKVFK